MYRESRWPSARLRKVIIIWCPEDGEEDESYSRGRARARERNNSPKSLMVASQCWQPECAPIVSMCNGGRRKSTFREWTRKQYTTLDCSPESLPIHSLTYLLDRSYTQRARRLSSSFSLSLSLSRSAFSPIHFHIHTYTPLNSPPSTHRAVLARLPTV